MNCMTICSPMLTTFHILLIILFSAPVELVYNFAEAKEPYVAHVCARIQPDLVVNSSGLPFRCSLLRFVLRYFFIITAQ